jgi:hypothetical protein
MSSQIFQDWGKSLNFTLDIVSKYGLVCCSCSCSCLWREIVSLNCGYQRIRCSSPRWYVSMESHGGMILTGEIEELRETCPIATSSTTNPTWTDLGVNPGLHSYRPATNHLSHGMAWSSINVTTLLLIT